MVRDRLIVKLFNRFHMSWLDKHLPLWLRWKIDYWVTGPIWREYQRKLK